ncbi:MAG: hypothetical protein ABR505_09015 [Actinomycetota bacterium]
MVGPLIYVGTYSIKPGKALAAELSKRDEPGVEAIRMPVHEAGFTRTSVR